MWFLQIDILIRLLSASVICAVAAALLGRFSKQRYANKFFIIIDLLLILYVSKRLFVFYIGYVLVTYLFIMIIKKIKSKRKFVFVILCFGCLVPFLYTRATTFFSILPFGLAMIGISYNMLKAIDAIYYTYYTGEDIPFLTYANFMLFFPVITAGPIFRYRDFLKTYENPEPITADSTQYSIKRFIFGMFKKVVVLMFVTKGVEYLLTLKSNWYYSIIIIAASYLILYLDMSGYADMAIATGRFMGIKVPENFKKPLESPSMTQFWRNWHVTLSDWIREHIFVVMNGKKLGRIQGALIGFFTMFFMCLWHGFTWAYVLDGILLGAVLVIENLFGITTVNKRKVKKTYYIFRCCITTILFALNSLLLTLGPEKALQVLNSFLL